MIRRTAITGFAATAIALAILGWVGYAIPVYRGYQVTNRLHLYVHFSGGLARFYTIRAQQNVYLDPTGGYTLMSVRRVSDSEVCSTYIHARPGRISSYALLWDTHRPPPRSAATSTVLLAGVRTRIWPPIFVMVAFPVCAISRDRVGQYRRRRRERRGLCPDCGYDLTGNISGACPECGKPIVQTALSMIRELFAHNDWGRDRLMALAEPLTDAKLDQPFEMGEGSLRKTLEHLSGAEWTWLGRCKGRSPVSGECPRDFSTMSDLWDQWRKTADERNVFLQSLTVTDLSRKVTYVHPAGKTYSFDLQHVLLHVCGHGTHHRAQALNMLRHLGVTVPEMDLLVMYERGGQGDG